MDWDYLPDWATSGSANLAKNANYNGVTYNPAINYKPPVLFDADGSLNTDVYKRQLWHRSRPVQSALPRVRRDLCWLTHGSGSVLA